MGEASEFIFGMQLGFAKAHHKITNLVAEYFGVVTMCSATKFTVLIFAVLNV